MYSGQFTSSPFTTLGQPMQYAPAPFTTAQFQASPGYQYNLQQGQNAVQNSNVGITGTLSGNTLNALQSNAMGLANQDWYNAMNQYYNQYNTAFNANNQNYWQQYNALNNQNLNAYAMYSGVANQGLSAATGAAAAGQANINQQNSNLLYGGNVQAAGQIGSANALNAGLTGVSNTLLAPPNNNSLVANLLGLQASSGQLPSGYDPSVYTNTTGGIY